MLAAVSVVLISSSMLATSRLCSEWKMWCTVLSPMFSFARPSPPVKWAPSISSSYVVRSLSSSVPGSESGTGARSGSARRTGRCHRPAPRGGRCRRGTRARCGRRWPGWPAGRGALDQSGRGHQLGEAVRPGDEVAVRVHGQQRHVQDVGVLEHDAEQVPGLGLDGRPGGQALAALAAEQPPGLDRVTGPVELELAEEDLVGGVRRVGLVLVHERRGGVGGVLDVVRALVLRCPGTGRRRSRPRRAGWRPGSAP